MALEPSGEKERRNS